MTPLKKLKVDRLTAIDVHVHVETEVSGNAANEAAKSYFGNSGAGTSRRDLAEYYRSRNIGCVVFTAAPSYLAEVRACVRRGCRLRAWRARRL